MSLFRHMDKCFIILLVIICAQAENDLPDNEVTTIKNLEATTEDSSEVVPIELNADMKRNERSFFGDLWGDIFDDCACNNCDCNPRPAHNNIQSDYNYNYNYGSRPRENDLHGLPVFKPWKPWKALKKFNLFGNGCGGRGNCNNQQVHYHHGYNNNNNDNNNDGYNYNTAPAPAPAPHKYEQPAPVYEKPAPVYEQPKYEKPAPVYEQPKYEEPTPVYEQPKYEESAPVYEEPKYVEPIYEKPTTVYKKPIYEKAEKSYDCVSNNCPPQPQLVYQPIIYLGPAQAHISEHSSEEEKESRDEVEDKYEAKDFYEEKHESKSSYEEKKEYEKEESEKNSSDEEKGDKKIIPIVPVYAPCSHGCGAPLPPLQYSVPQHQVINYNGLVPSYAPIAPHYGAYSPAPVNHGCGYGCPNYGPVYNYPVPSSHASYHSPTYSHGSSPSYSQSPNHESKHHASNHHSTSHHYPNGHHIHQFPALNQHDQPYLACPELFAAYNEHIAHLTSTNSLY